MSYRVPSTYTRTSGIGVAAALFIFLVLAVVVWLLTAFGLMLLLDWANSTDARVPAFGFATCLPLSLIPVGLIGGSRS